MGRFARLATLAPYVLVFLTIGCSKGEPTESQMDKYVCTVCGYVYDQEKGDPDGGIAPGTKFEDVPDDWVCPVCGISKDMFEKIKEE